MNTPTESALIAAALNLAGVTKSSAAVLPIPRTTPELVVCYGERGELLELLACPQCSGPHSLDDCPRWRCEADRNKPLERHGDHQGVVMVAPAEGKTSDVCAKMRALCSSCGGTGDVTRADGEWLGKCTCIFGRLMQMSQIIRTGSYFDGNDTVFTETSATDTCMLDDILTEVFSLARDAASKERGGDALDAERYRWLRNPDPQPYRSLDVMDDSYMMVEGRALDDAIDAAMLAEGRAAKPSP